MSIVDFKAFCESRRGKGSIREGMHFLYNCMWPFLKQVCEDRQKLKGAIKEMLFEFIHYTEEEEEFYKKYKIEDVMRRDDPLTFSKIALEAIKAAARQRARCKSYLAERPEDKKIVV